MTEISCVTVYFVAMVLLCAAVSKCIHFQDFLGSLLTWHLVSSGFTFILSIGVIISEFSVAVSIALWPRSLLPIFAAALLLVSFTVYAAYAILFHKDHSCNCFGKSERIDAVTLGRNLLLSAAALGGALMNGHGGEGLAIVPDLARRATLVMFGIEMGLLFLIAFDLIWVGRLMSALGK